MKIIKIYKIIRNSAIFFIIILTSFSAAPQENSIEMVLVEGGIFRMGSNRGRADERPVHEVYLDDFYIGKYEVTQAQWDMILERDSNIRYFEGCRECPVERISWYNVQEFISALNHKTGMNYRLPTEAEWEYAARGGNYSRGYKFSGSDTADCVAWTDGNAGNMVHPVGMKKPNELGLYDMSGNVYEWCSDWYSADYYKFPATDNPFGPAEGTQKVIRGGSWFLDRSGIRVFEREGGNPTFRYGYIGFRLCRSAGR